jgi:hypothetical protein
MCWSKRNAWSLWETSGAAVSTRGPSTGPFNCSAAYSRSETVDISRLIVGRIAEYVVRGGDPQELVLEYFSNQPVDMVIVGSRGLEKVKR